jgi:hypothetical protein
MNIIKKRKFIMNTLAHAMFATAIVMALLIGAVSGCGSSADDGSVLQNIPQYPNATEGESMEQSIGGGFIGGSMQQYTTTDPFDEVVNFYAEALIGYDTEILTNESQLGRQTAISIPQKRGMVSIAIQEFTEDETVNITFMAVGD